MQGKACLVLSGSNFIAILPALPLHICSERKGGIRNRISGLHFFKNISYAWQIKVPLSSFLKKGKIASGIHRTLYMSCFKPVELRHVQLFFLVLFWGTLMRKKNHLIFCFCHLNASTRIKQTTHTHSVINIHTNTHTLPPGKMLKLPVWPYLFILARELWFFFFFLIAVLKKNMLTYLILWLLQPLF